MLENNGSGKEPEYHYLGVRWRRNVWEVSGIRTREY